MKPVIVYTALLVTLTAYCYPQAAGTAGAFARMGFGARGMAMGNALSAVNAGDVSSYYNPALAPFAEQKTASATIGILSLDRSLNFLSYTQPLPPHAGLSAGLINAGVNDIDGRDNDGYHTEDYSIFENQFYLSFGNRVDERVSLGVTIKLYYSKLFEKVTSTTVGFDVGGLVQLTDALSAGLVAQDVNAKYKWDTKSIYDVNGKPTEDKFPTLYKAALAYKLPLSFGTGTIDGEFVHTTDNFNFFRFGADAVLTENFSIRGGADRIDFSDQATGIKPSFGFTLKNSFNGWTPSISYAYVIEGFTPHNMHIITISGTF